MIFEKIHDKLKILAENSYYTWFIKYLRYQKAVFIFYYLFFEMPSLMPSGPRKKVYYFAGNNSKMHNYQIENRFRSR